jgi:hypothetical protein
VEGWDLDIHVNTKVKSVHQNTLNIVWCLLHICFGCIF